MKPAPMVIGALVVLLGTPLEAFAASPEPQVLLADAQFPTNMVLAPDGRLFFTEKENGAVRIIEDGKLLPNPFAAIPVKGGAETGMLGITLHPDFPVEPWVYLYLSYKPSRINRIVRAEADGNTASRVEPVMDLLPISGGYHNGGDMAFGPDGKLYVTVGEAHDETRAQDPTDIGGKILRLNDDGSIPEDNPLGPDNPLYSLGHRNSFGICFDDEGHLWETENGPDSHDEVNLIEAGGNYGWPVVSGPSGSAEFLDPVLDFPEIIAPTGCAVVGDTLWFGDYHGNLHAADIQALPMEDTVVADVGSGITDVMAAPDGTIYVSTTDSILVLSDSPVEAVEAPPAPEALDEETGNSTATWIAAVVAGLTVLLGGLWFRRISKREEAAEPPESETPIGPDA